jgi:hypothetical protein
MQLPGGKSRLTYKRSFPLKLWTGVVTVTAGWCGGLSCCPAAQPGGMQCSDCSSCRRAAPAGGFCAQLEGRAASADPHQVGHMQLLSIMVLPSVLMLSRCFQSLCTAVVDRRGYCAGELHVAACDVCCRISPATTAY